MNMVSEVLFRTFAWTPRLAAAPCLMADSGDSVCVCVCVLGVGGYGGVSVCVQVLSDLMKELVLVCRCSLIE